VLDDFVIESLLAAEFHIRRKSIDSNLPVHPAVNAAEGANDTAPATYIQETPGAYRNRVQNLHNSRMRPGNIWKWGRTIHRYPIVAARREEVRFALCLRAHASKYPCAQIASHIERASHAHAAPVAPPNRTHRTSTAV
jgi:hypothetical protein